MRLSDRTRQHLRENWPAIKTGVATVGLLVGIELGESVARMLPTRIADNLGRSRVKAEIDRRIEHLIDWLKSERDRDA